MNPFLEKEIKGSFLEWQKLRWCAGIVPLIMCVLYMACSYFFFTPAEYSSLEDAYHANRLTDSPSALVAFIAQLMVRLNTFSLYAIDKLGRIVIILNALADSAIFYNILTALNFFMIPRAQLKRIFIPLPANEFVEPANSIQEINIPTVEVLPASAIRVSECPDQTAGEHPEPTPTAQEGKVP